MADRRRLFVSRQWTGFLDDLSHMRRVIEKGLLGFQNASDWR
jgi:hypothetical protein